MRRPIRVALFDLDGVIRHYDPAHAAAAEADHGLPAGILLSAAFDAELAVALTTGRLSRQAWVEDVGVRIGSPGAARQWAARPGTIDPAMVALLDEVRAGSCAVALFSNGSDELRKELADLGVLDRFDVVVNSAEIGLAKPDRAAFERACGLVGARPDEIFFVDDTATHVDAAIAVGIRAVAFRGVVPLRSELAHLGVLDGSAGSTAPPAG